MDAGGYESVDFAHVGEAVLRLADGRIVTVPGHVGLELLLARAREGLPPIPVTVGALDGISGHGNSSERRSKTLHQSLALPKSIMPDPVTLWERRGASITCERVIPYSEGFEIQLRQHGLESQATPNETLGSHTPNAQFHGLKVGLRYSDGRVGSSSDTEIYVREREITVVTFTREGLEADSLWLWVTPPAPAGDVLVHLEWTAYDIESVGCAFDGSALQLSDEI